MSDMNGRISIPVRVINPEKDRARPLAAEAEAMRQRYEELDRRPQVESTPESKEEAPGGGVPAPLGNQAATRDAAVKDVLAPEASTGTQVDEWRDRALRLQAEMANYRKRQQRLVQEQIQAERKRLLNAFLQVVDDLERALEANVTDARALYQGVELTHRAALQLLQKEAVEQIEAVGQPFDPNWHEAIAAIAPGEPSVPQGTVLQATEPGYRLDEQLLRPAKVIVAA